MEENSAILDSVNNMAQMKASAGLSDLFSFFQTCFLLAFLLSYSSSPPADKSQKYVKSIKLTYSIKKLKNQLITE